MSRNIRCLAAAYLLMPTATSTSRAQVKFPTDKEHAKVFLGVVLSSSATIPADNRVPIARLKILTRDHIGAGRAGIEDVLGAIRNPVPAIQRFRDRILPARSVRKH